MGYALNAVTAPDAYTAASTIENVPIRSLVIDVVNQGIFWSVKEPSGGSSGSGGNWDDLETYMLPGSRRIVGNISGIRFRAAVKAASLPAGAVQASVTVRTVP